MLRCGLPDIRHGITHLFGKIDLGAGKKLRRILIHPFHFRRFGCQLFHPLCAAHGDLFHACLVGVVDNAPERRRQRVIHMQDRPFGTTQAFHSTLNQLVAGLGQHFNGDIIGNMIFLNQATDKVELGL